MMVEAIEQRIKSALDKFPPVRQSFVFLLNHLNGQKEIVAAEIGVYQGLNAVSMMGNCSRLKLYCIDGYERISIETGGAMISERDKQAIRDCSVSLLNPFKDRVIRIFQQSEVCYKDFPDEYFDYVYIDGEHLYDYVKRDIELWYPKVKKGGMLAGHDFEMKEVMHAVAEFRDINNMKHFAFSTGGGESDWWFIKQ